MRKSTTEEHTKVQNAISILTFPKYIKLIFYITFNIISIILLFSKLSNPNSIYLLKIINAVFFSVLIILFSFISIKIIKEIINIKNKLKIVNSMSYYVIDCYMYDLKFYGKYLYTKISPINDINSISTKYHYVFDEYYNLGTGYSASIINSKISNKKYENICSLIIIPNDKNFVLPTKLYS